MVSAAGISNQHFMAGRMVFDQPAHANAKISNAGTITVKQAGLAALVAPQVANSGTISAQLGHVVLAGAKTATLDLYGDGLLSLDVTNQVTEAPVGADGKKVTALVTNTGVVIADGGTVQLTARAADGIVQNLVQAGGKIRAATMGDQTGTIALNGVGGSIVVAGQLSTPGRAPGTARRQYRGRCRRRCHALPRRRGSMRRGRRAVGRWRSARRWRGRKAARALRWRGAPRT